MSEEKINMSISDGEPFFAHELSINFNPMQFIFDFKCITPRVDPRSQSSATIALKHNVVMVDPYHARKIHQLLSNVLKKYESDFGKIDKPKAVAAFEKKHKKKEAKEAIQESPAYFG